MAECKQSDRHLKETKKDTLLPPSINKKLNQMRYTDKSERERKKRHRATKPGQITWNTSERVGTHEHSSTSRDGNRSAVEAEKRDRDKTERQQNSRTKAQNKQGRVRHNRTTKQANTQTREPPVSVWMCCFSDRAACV